MRRREFFGLVAGATIILACAGSLVAADARAEPETVYFPSADGRTQLVGYLFAPRTAGPHPAVVMLHGRGGPYSSNINEGCTLVAKDNSSPCNASSLSKRHAAWGIYWADRGYLALLPDSFGPRSKGHGFGRFSHDDPDRDDVNEQTVRPLDAEGALKYLQSRKEVAPVKVFLASDDEEVSPAVCHRVLDFAPNNGAPIKVVDYAGATHDFDDPGEKRQSVDGNRTAREDVMRRASGLFAN